MYTTEALRQVMRMYTTERLRLEIKELIKGASKDFMPHQERLARNLGMDNKTRTWTEVTTGATTFILRACLLHNELERPFLPDCLSGLLTAWKQDLESMVFRMGALSLHALAGDPVAESAVDRLASFARHHSRQISDEGSDFLGPIFNDLITTAKGDGAFYTKPVSAELLARLALPRDCLDGIDDVATQVRVIDPACGSGTLLIAAKKVLQEHLAEKQVVTKEIKQAINEHCIVGYDINEDAVCLAQSTIGLDAQQTDDSRMKLRVMPHGPQSDGSVKAGALELLKESVDDIYDGLCGQAPRQPDLPF